jgi:O-antigen/teichoic acid export membrane protein
MSAIKKLASQTAVYGLSSILARVANFLLLTPLYTDKNIFSVEQFGVVTNTYAWVAMLIIFFTYGLETGFFRFTSNNEADREAVYSTAFISLLCSSLLFVAALVYFSAELADAIKYPDHQDYIVLLGLIVGLDAMTAIPFAGLRMKEKAFRFAFIKIFSLLINIGLNFFYYVVCPYITGKYNYQWLNTFMDLVYDPHSGVRYVFISNLIASLVTLVLLLPEIVKHQWTFNFVLWKKLIVYSSPLLIVGLAGAINQHFDKLIFPYIMSKEMADHELGIYGAIYKLSIMITLVIQAYQYAAEPFFFKKSGDKDAKKLYSDVLKYFTIATCVGFLGILLYIDFIKHFIRNDAYFEGLFILPYLLMSAVFFGIYYNLSIWYKLSGKTYYGAIISGVGSILTLVGNIVLIPVFENLYPGKGYFGAAIVTFACYFIMVVISYVLGQKYYPVQYPLKRIAFYMLLAVALVGLNNFLNMNSGLYKYIVNTLILLVYLATVYILERPKKVII